MAVAVPVTDEERDRIRQLHSAGKSANAIAKDLGRSQSTITRQCQQMGLSFGREQTRAAVKAHVLDAQGRRAALAEAYLSDAEKLRAQLWQPYEDFAPVGGQDPTVLHWTRDEPSFPDKLKAMQASGLAADKHMKLSEFDTATGVDHAKSMLGRLFSGLAEAADKLGSGEDGEPGGT